MKAGVRFAIPIFCAGLLAVLPSPAQDPASSPEESQEKSPIDWQEGPGIAKIGNQAQIELPEGYLYAGPEGAATFLQLTENIPNGDELGILAPPEGGWFVIFTFDDVGYVKDDEKDSLDLEAMLESIQEGTDQANEVRRERGWTTISVTGWIVEPHYDDVTHNLEWSLRVRDDVDQSEAANHHTRYLGRRGVMNVELVAGTEEFDAVLPVFRDVMGGFSYTAGSDYRSFVQGDKVAEYGLTALVVGGAAAAAAKTGLLKGLWKLVLAGWKVIALALAGLGGAIKKYLFPKKPTPDSPDPIS